MPQGAIYDVDNRARIYTEVTRYDFVTWEDKVRSGGSEDDEIHGRQMIDKIVRLTMNVPYVNISG